MKAFTTYLKNVRAELTHVIWPTRRQGLTHVALILIISTVMAVFIAALDYVFTHIVGALL